MRRFSRFLSLLVVPVLVAILVSGCDSEDEIRPDVTVTSTNQNLTPEAQALFINLDALRQNHVLFGHQDDLAYGVHWRREDGRSDVREVVGSFPAVYGWELGDLEYGAEENLDGVNFEDMQRWIREGYERGGVITIGWHMNNPVSGGNAWDTTRAVAGILPGGEQHETFVGWLDTFGDFVQDLRGANDELIPIIFRPYHEMTGSWFWWGRDLTSPEDYIALWRFTVDYLRNNLGLNNLLYAYSTDVFDTEERYLEHYPGDDYVDILGFDDYQALRSDETVPDMTNRLRMLVELAEERGKIPALTETGLEQIPDENWWTGRLLRAIESDPVAQRIAYVLIWRNANSEYDRPDHYYAPYPGHPSEADFIRFRESSLILFEDDLPNLYE